MARRRAALLSACAGLALYAGATASAMAQSVTSTGSVSPSPPPGTGSWFVPATITVGNAAAGTITVAGGGSVTSGVVSAGTNGFSGTVTVTGSGSEWNVLAGTGEMVLGSNASGLLTVTDGGAVTVSAGVKMHDLATVTLTNGGVLATAFIENVDSSATLDIDGGVLRALNDQSDFLTNFDSVTLGDDGVIVDSYGFDIGIQTDLDGSGGLEKIGAGTLTLSGVNTYTGATTITAGTLEIDGLASMSADSDVTVAAGARLSVTDGTLAAVRTLAGAGTVDLNDEGTLSFGWADDTVSSTFAGDIAGSGELIVEGGALTLTGTGTLDTLTVCECGGLTISGDDADLTVSGPVASGGGTEVDGVLAVRDGASFFTTGLSLNGAMEVDGTDSSVIVDDEMTISDLAGLPSSLTIGGGATMTSRYYTLVEGTDPSLTPPTITVTGAGSTWNVEADLTLGGLFAPGGAVLNVADGGSVSVDGDLDAGAYVPGGFDPAAIDVRGAGSELAVTGTLTIGGFGASGDLAATMTIDEGGVVVAEVSTQLAVRAGSSGAIDLLGDEAGRGVLETGFVRAGSGSVSLNLDGGVLRAAGNEGAFLRGFDSLAIGAGGAFVDSNGFGIGIATDFGGTGGLTKLGAGTLWLSGDNTFTGATTVAAGTLSAETDGALSAESDVTVNAGATLAVADDVGAGVRTLAGAGTVALGDGATLSYGAADATVASAFSGRLEGAGMLLVDGGTLTLTGTGEIDGLDVCDCGTLVVSGAVASLDVSGDPSLGGGVNVTGALSVEDGASLTASLLAALGTVAIDGVGTTVTVDEETALGGLPGVSGSLTVSGGASLTSRGTVFIEGLDATPPTASVDGGAAWTVEDDLYVGGESFGGTGALTVSGGSSVDVAGEMRIGASEDFGLPASTVSVTGAGSSLSVDGELAVGGSDCGCGELAGVLTVADGATVTAGSMTVGTLGVVEIGDGGAAGTLDTAAIANDGAIVADFTGATTLAAAIGGTGTLTKRGAGTLTLTGTSTYGGATSVEGGRLRVDGRLTASDVTVAAGGSLAGTGTIDRAVTVAAGGTLVGSGGATLTMGSLALSAGADVDITIAGGGTQALFSVTGDLVLDGTLNIAGPGIMPGVTRLFDYGGTLTDNGLVIGDVPVGTRPDDFSVQTSIARQVNLVNASGDVLRFWDGGDPAKYDNGVVDGGDGVWQRGGRAWTTADGAVNGPMQPMPGFAVFEGAAGTVTVDNGAGQVSASGLQFAVDGYRLQGDDLLLAGADGRTTLRVGDGTAAGAGYRVVVATALTGASRLVKTDLGTAVLTGENRYSGGTTIVAGTLQIGNGGTRGSILGDVENDGVLAFARSDTSTFAGDVSGSGVVRQVGTGTTVLTGALTHTGGTVISAGTLQVGDGGTDGRLTGNVRNDDTLAFARSNRLTFSGDITGSGVVRQIGTGTTIVTGTAAHTGGTVITAGTLQIGNGGTRGSLGGDVRNDGTLAFNRSDAIVFSGNITGTGALRQDGSGATVLTGAATHTGGTVISAGMLVVGDGGRNGRLAGDVDNDSVLAFNRAGRMTFAGDITGIGTVRQIGSGTTVLTGAATHTGTTLISDGALHVGNGGTRGFLSGDVQNDSVLAFDRSDEVTFSGALRGIGVLRQIGTGTTVLTGAATHTGGTVVAAGTLQIGDGGSRGSLSGDVENDGTLAFNRADDVTFAGTISGAGAVQQIGTGTTTLAGVNTYSGGTLVSAGRLVGSATSFGSDAIRNDAVLVFHQTTDGTLANVLEGGGRIVKRGAGTLELTGRSSWNGTFAIDAGRVAVNGSARGTFVVGDGGDLGGSGRIGALTVASGGVVAPGNSIGRLKINGDFDIAAGATYAIEVSASGAADLVAASGSATIDGGTVAVVADSGRYAARTDYTILTADAGITGTFDAVEANFAFLDPRLRYDATSVMLTLVRNDTDFGSIGRTRNERAAGRGVESLGAGNPLYDAVLGLSKPAARDAFDQLSGEIHASASTVFVEDSRLVREAAIGRLRSALASPGAATTPVITYTDGRPEAVEATTDRFAAWGQGFGAFGRWDGDGNAATLTSTAGGFLVGADWRMFEDWRVGAVAGYGRTNFDDDRRGSSGSSDDYHLGVFAGTQWGALGVRAGAAMTWHDVDTDRHVAFPGFSDDLHADYNARVAQAFGELGYGVRTRLAAFEPFANLAYVRLDTDDFRERGGAAALRSAAVGSDTAFTTLGLRASAEWAAGEATVAARGALGWRHAFGGLTPKSRFAFAGGNNFTIAGVPVAADAAVIEAGLDLRLGAGLTLGASYAGQFGSDASDQTVRGTFALKF